ncbi:transglycosylase SLT domain-containing protein [Acinetobacter sp. ANC 4639]
MAASLGRLTLDLVTRISSFTEPLERAERQAEDSTKKITKSFDVASLAVKALGAAAAGLSVASVMAYAEKFIDAGNNIQKFAKLSNASIQQFQYYAVGANTAGISMESFADKMKDMQDRIGEFQRTGGGPLSDFFNDIAPRVGVTIDQFQKLSGPQALQLFYDSLQKAGASTNDMKFYMESIINDSSLLIPLLENGGKGFKKWGDAAQQAGSIMSDDMVKELALAKENLQLLDLQWQGFEAELVNVAVPALKEVMTHMDEVKAVATVLGAYLVGAAVPATAKYVAGVYDKITALVAERQQILLNTEIEAVKAARTAHLTGIELANAEAQLVRLSGMQRLAFVEQTLIPLQAAHAAALQADTVAQEANNAAKLTAANVGRGLLGVLGGPVGLGITVAAVAASYLLLKDNTKDTAQVLDTQGKSVDELVQKWQQLNAVQKDTAISQLTKQVEDLRVKYVTASSDLSAYIGYMEDSGRVSESVAQQIQQQYQQYSQGKITADQFYSAVKSINGVSDEQITKIRDLVSANDGAKSAYSQQKDVLNQLNQKTDDAAKKQQQHADATNNTAAAYALLTQKQMEYVRGVEKTLSRQAYIQALVTQQNFSRDKAESYATAQEQANGNYAYKKPLPNQVKLATDKEFSSKNYTFTKADLATIAKVNGIASAHNFAQIESLYGLPKGTLAAYVLGESGGNANAVSPTGATGLFQTTGIFREQYGLSKNSSVEAQATAVADAIAKGIDEFGNLPDALRSLNAGIAGTKQYLAGNIGNGKGQMSPTKAKEVAGYAPKFAKNLAGVNGKSSIDQSILMPSQEDLLAQQAAAAEATKAQQDKELEIKKKYYTKEQQLAQDNADAIKEINSTLTGSARSDALVKQTALYQSQLTTLHAQEKDEYNQLHAFETDRITQLKNEYDVKKQLAEADLSKSPAQRKDTVATLDRQMQAEIDAVKREEAQQVLSAQQATMDSIELMKQQYALERQEIVKNKALSDIARKEILAAKDADFQHNLKNAELERDARILAAQEGLLTESAMVVARYQLEHEQLKNITGVSKEEIDARLAYQELAQQKSLKKLVEDNQKAYREAYNSALGLPTNQFDVNHQTVKDLQKGSNELRDSQLGESQNAQDNLTTGLADQYSQGLISEQEYQTQLTDIVQQGEDERAKVREDAAQREQDIQNVSKQLQLQTELQYGEQIFGSMAETMKGAFGEQSAAYKAAFAVQKAFAIAQSMVAIQTGIALAAGQPFPENLAAMASVAAATASIISNISSVAAGFATGGYTGSGGKYDVAGIVHKGEVVWSQEDVARSGGVGAVERARRGGISGYADGGVVGGLVGFDASTSQSRIASALTDSLSSNQGANITINNNSGAQVNAQQNSDGSITIDVVDQMIKRSWQQLNNANSRESKSLARNTTARRNR